MGVFGAVFGCSGVVGFNGCCSGACSGDGGFMLACISGRRGDGGFTVATWLGPVREKVRPAWSDGGREREKVRPACSKWPEIGVLWRAGRSFSRLGMRGPLLGELFRGNVAGGPLLGEFFAPIGPEPRSCRQRGARGWLRWGFCSIRSWLAACRRRVVPLMTPFPPFGGGPVAPSAASARAPSRRTSPRRVRRRSLTTTSSRRRRNMSAALDRLKQQNELE